MLAPHPGCGLPTPSHAAPHTGCGPPALSHTALTRGVSPSRRVIAPHTGCQPFTLSNMAPHMGCQPPAPSHRASHTGGQPPIPSHTAPHTGGQPFTPSHSSLTWGVSPRPESHSPVPQPAFPGLLGSPVTEVGITRKRQSSLDCCFKPVSLLSAQPRSPWRALLGPCCREERGGNRPASNFPWEQSRAGVHSWSPSSSLSLSVTQQAWARMPGPLLPWMQQQVREPLWAERLLCGCETLLALAWGLGSG